MNYIYSTKKVSVIWSKRPQITQPIGYFFSAKEAIEAILKFDSEISDYIINCGGEKIPACNFLPGTSKVN